MHWQWNLYATLSLIAATVSLSVVLFTLRRGGSKIGATPLISMMLAATIWSIGYALELAATEFSAKILLAQIQYLGITSVPPMMFVLAVEYTSRERWKTGRNFFLLMLIPLLTLILVATNRYHGLFWQTISQIPVGSFTILEFEYGPLFWLNFGYAYLLLVWGTWLLFQAFLREQRYHRAQAGALLIAVLMPWVGNFLYITGLNPLPGFDLTPFAFTLTGVIAAWGMFQLKLLDILPVARSVVIETMTDEVIVLDVDDRIVDVNPAAQQLIGSRLEKIMGQPVRTMMPEYFDALPPFQALAENRAELAVEKNDLRQYYDLRIAPLQNRQGVVNGRVLTLHNTTAQKQTEMRLRETRQRLEAQNREMKNLSRAVEQSGSAVIITDLSGIIQFVNPAFSRVTGYSFEEAIGMHTRALKSGVHEPEFYQNMWQTISGGNVWQGELINKRKDGELYWEAATISPVRDSDGEIFNYLAIKDDISKRKAMELALAEARDEALEASRLKSQLLANVSHDMRSPLGSILGYTEMIQQGVYGSVSELQYEILTKIILSTDHALNFISNLLSQAQIESGRVVINEKPFAPSELLSAVESTATALAAAKDLALIKEVSPEMPTRLIGDPYWLRQIVANLVGNAIKFTDAGIVSIQISPADEAHWVIRVSDTGHGIPLDAQPRIFDAFWQVDGTETKKQHVGSGLGLSIVKQLVTLMEGEITLISEENQGSQFSVILPLKVSNGDEK